MAYRLSLPLRSLRLLPSRPRAPPSLAAPLRARALSTSHLNLFPTKPSSGTPAEPSPFPETAPGWNESLATESEADIKAENASEHPNSPDEDLIEKTIEDLHKKHGK